MDRINLVLLAGGQGTRMKRNIPKQHLLLHGKPIIVHILEKIDRIESINKVIITCPKDYITKTDEIIKKYGVSKELIYVEAGATRQESVYKALQYVNSPQVIIHEAARPFVTTKEFEELIYAYEENLIYAIDLPFTVLQGDEYIRGVLKRSELLNIQLPQKFNTGKLKNAHEWAKKMKRFYTEDTSLYYEYTNEDIKVLTGTEYNIKITKPIDLKIAEIIYREYILGEE